MWPCLRHHEEITLGGRRRASLPYITESMLMEPK
jgi:hypothetical protein